MSFVVANREVCAILGKQGDHWLAFRGRAAGGGVQGCSAMEVDVVGVGSCFKKKARGIDLGEVDGMLQSWPVFAKPAMQGQLAPRAAGAQVFGKLGHVTGGAGHEEFAYGGEFGCHGCIVNRFKQRNENPVKKQD